MPTRELHRSDGCREGRRTFSLWTGSERSEVVLEIVVGIKAVTLAGAEQSVEDESAVAGARAYPNNPCDRPFLWRAELLRGRDPPRNPDPQELVPPKKSVMRVIPIGS